MKLYEFVVSDRYSERHVFVIETSEEAAWKHVAGHDSSDVHLLADHDVTVGTYFTVTTEQRPI